MYQTFQLYPDKKTYTIPELEALLEFKYLDRIAFETPEEQQEIQARGLAKWKNNDVTPISLELGDQFIKEIEAGYIANVSVRRIDERLGCGLFAEEDLKRGAYVGEYTGIVRKNAGRATNDYLYGYPVLDESGGELVIDATQGCLTRFINHSFYQNLKQHYAFYDGFYHLIFLVDNPIEKGTQLSYNYGHNYWYIRKQPVALPTS